MVKSPGWPDVLSVADEQWGLVTKQQVEDAGVAWSTLSRQVGRQAFERIAHGVYRVRGGGEAEQIELRAAWLQLAPATPVWERAADQGVVSHRSAAAVCGLGHLPADVHEFTLPVRRQSRRADVRLHRGEMAVSDWVNHRGLPVTRPARTAADLLSRREDPGAVGELIADALRAGLERPGGVAAAIARHAGPLGLSPRDGHALLSWLLELTGDPMRQIWIDESAAVRIVPPPGAGAR